jgi:hypothetical protein
VRALFLDVGAAVGRELLIAATAAPTVSVFAACSTMAVVAKAHAAFVA